MSLYPLSKIHKIRPVAAADYFLTNPILAWLSINCIDIIPLQRNSQAKKSDLFAACHQALDKDDIVILFPEGSRGFPEQMGAIKKGLFHIVNNRTDTQITLIFMQGLGQSLPRGEALFVPFNCDVIIAEALPKSETAEQLIEQIKQRFSQLQKYCVTKSQPY